MMDEPRIKSSVLALYSLGRSRNKVGSSGIRGVGVGVGEVGGY